MTVKIDLLAPTPIIWTDAQKAERAALDAAHAPYREAYEVEHAIVEYPAVEFKIGNTSGAGSIERPHIAHRHTLTSERTHGRFPRLIGPRRPMAQTPVIPATVAPLRLAGMTERDSYRAVFESWTVDNDVAPLWKTRDDGTSHKAALAGVGADSGTGHVASAPYRALRDELATQILDILETSEIVDECPALAVSETTGQIIYVAEPQSAVAARLAALVSALDKASDADVSGLMGAYRVPKLARMVDSVAEDAIGSGRVTLAIDAGRWVATHGGSSGTSSTAIVAAIGRRNMPAATLPNLPTPAGERKDATRQHRTESETAETVQLARRMGWDADDALAFYRLFHPMGKVPTAVRSALETLSAIG